MNYGAKNYTEQGGDVTHIGGKLIIEDGAEVEGLDSGGSSYTLPTASAKTLGGVKAKAKSNETVEVAVDGEGKLYVPAYPTIPKMEKQTILVHNLKDKEHPKELLTEEMVELLTAPADLAGYKAAITEALYKGTKRNIESEEDPKKTRRSGNRRGTVYPAFVLRHRPASSDAG